MNDTREEMNSPARSPQHHVVSGSSWEVHEPPPAAPYGKACAHCVKSKTRCAGTSGRKCERCQRLNKDCLPAPTLRRKRVAKRRPASSTLPRTTALEEKLDDLIQMLQRSQGASIPATSPAPDQIRYRSLESTGITDPVSDDVRDVDKIPLHAGRVQGNTVCGDFFPDSTSSSRPAEDFDESSSQNGVANWPRGGHQRSNYSQINGPPTPALSRTGNGILSERPHSLFDYPLETEAELEDYLETYRMNMVPYFPIVCIGAEMTVEKMRKERPFLYLVIRAICSKNLARQTALLQEVKRVLGSEMLLGGSKNLDLFLGVLVFASWSHYYICDKPIISTIIQLGISLASDLGLMRPLPTEPVTVMLHFSAQGCPKSINKPNVVRTIEERRAAVGLFLISVISANYFQRLELMRWSPYLNECLQLLEEKKDYATDELLVYLVKLQLICNKVVESTWNEIFDGTATPIPTDFYVKAVQAQLEDFKNSLPSGLQSNSIVVLKLHILSTTLSIHEHSLSSVYRSIPSDSITQLQQIESLWTCLTVVKSWLESFFSLDNFPLSSYHHMSMTLFTQMAHCIVALYRLSFFQVPDISWDRQKVRQEIDLGDIFQLLASRWDQVYPLSSVESGIVRANDDPMSNARKRFRGMAKWWDAKVAVLDAANTEHESSLAKEHNGYVSEFGAAEQEQIEGFGASAMDMDMLDETWMRDLLGGNYDFNLELPYF